MNVAVVGGGSWGTALAVQLVRAGHQPTLWVRDPVLAAEIAVRHENSRYLPGISLPPVAATADLGDAVSAAEMVFVVVPSAYCRSLYSRLNALLEEGTPVVSATKGLEIDSLLRMTEVAHEAMPRAPLAALSGPTFALEVAQGQPTTVVVASSDLNVAEQVQRVLSTSAFRAYSSDDVVGVELGGALKNVIAIAAGIVDGLGFGHNTLAALITRGLAEMTRLAVRMGARPDTLAGLAGLGDLVLTCTGGLSRNRRVGQALAVGRPLEQALERTHMVAEGIRTTAAACALAHRVGVEMPIAEQMQAVIYEGRSAREGVEALMLRSLKRE